VKIVFTRRKIGFKFFEVNGTFGFQLGVVFTVNILSTVGQQGIGPSATHAVVELAASKISLFDYYSTSTAAVADYKKKTS
jgi:hypothetical protein